MLLTYYGVYDCINGLRETLDCIISVTVVLTDNNYQLITFATHNHE